MAKTKSLYKCLPPSYLKELRENLGKTPKSTVTDADVLAFMREKGVSTSRAVENSKLQALAYARMWEKVMKYTNKDGVVDPKAGLKALLYTDRKEMFAGSSLEAKMDAIARGAHMELGEMITDFAPRAWGLKRNREFQDGLIDALFGKVNVDNKYSRYAAALNELNERLVARYNRTGGNLVYDGRHMPIESDPTLTKAAGSYKDWYLSIRDDLDLRAMGIDEKGGLVALRSWYQDIMTDGTHSMSMDTAETMNSFQKRYGRMRTLKFKTSEGWLKYNKRFSKETPYSAIMDNITHMTKEIGIRESFGPAPDANFVKLARSVVVKSGDKEAAVFAQKAWKNVTMALNPTNPRMADHIQAARNIQTGTKLTGATLSAMPDVIFNATTARYNGLPAFGVLKRQVDILTEFGGTSIRESQLQASKMGFLLEHALDSTFSTSRFGDVSGKNWTSRFAEAVMRGSGLSRWTIAGKQAFHMEFISLLGTDFSNNKNLMRSFRRYGLTKGDMDEIINSKNMIIGGHEFMDPSALKTETMEKVFGMISSESKYAVPEPDIGVQAFMNQGQKRGEAGGEILRTSGQFKAFSVTIIMNHMARTLHGSEGNLAGRMRYGATILTGATMLGVLTTQLKEISRGNKPFDWDSRALWSKGFAAGGALSIAGDIILSDVTKYGTSLQDFLLGPLGGEANKILWEGLIGDGGAVLKADKTLESLVREFGDEAINYIPGQFWYTRLAFDRLLYDNLHKAANPKWQLKEVQREVKRRQVEGANERWWK